MGQQFKRNTKLVISTMFTQYTYAFPDTDLDMSFDVLLRSGSLPNTGIFDLWNMNPDTVAAITAEKDYSKVQFFAGYGYDPPPLIFTGSLTNVTTTRGEGDPDIKTTIYAADGQREFDEAYFSKTYEAGTVLDSIVSDIASALKLTLTSKYPELLFVKTVKAVSLEGKAKRCLDNLAADFDFKWSVLLGNLEIMKKGEAPTKERTATVISASTGMIGSPSLSWSKDKKKLKDTAQFVGGVSVRANLNGEVKPDRFIEIRSENTAISYGDMSVEAVPNKTANGFYLVDQVRFRGDNRSGPFEIEVKANVR